MDGGTIWNTNIEQAVDMCTEHLGYENSEEDIIIDILITETKDNIPEWKKSGNAAANFLRSENIKSAQKGSNVIDTQKRTHPDIEWRLLITQSNEMRAEIIDELDFGTRVTQPLIETGKCDGAKALNQTNQTEYEACMEVVKALMVENPSIMTMIKHNANHVGLLALLLTGPIVALFGKKLFPWVSATVGTLIVIPLVVFLCSGRGWLDHTSGFWLVVVGALALGILAGVILYKSVWVGIGLIGTYAGYLCGFILYGVLLYLTGWHSQTAAFWFGIVGAIAGGAVAFKYGKQLIIVGTAFVGSYMWTRGFSLVFDPGYPSEAELVRALSEGEEVNLGWHFVVYIALFVISTIVCAVFQFHTEKKAPSDDEDDEKEY